jgi:hypothetical protein
LSRRRPAPESTPDHKSAPDNKGKRAKSHVFLVAVKQRREALRVYAVLTLTQDEALAIVASASAEGAAVEAAGRLSKKLARPLKLKPEVPHPI